MDLYSDKLNELIKDKYKCPLCLSEDIEDISTYESNGIFGPGYTSWKLSDFRCCKNCGIVFKPTKNNKI